MQREVILPDLKQRENKEPYPFQIEGVKFLLNSPSPYLYVGDSMGLGKTIQGLLYANSVYADNLLIICPAGLRLNWLLEANLWYKTRRNQGVAILKSADVTRLLQKSMQRHYLPSPLIVSYDLLVRNSNLRRYIHKRHWDLMILDEAHYIKNIGSYRTQVVREIWDSCKRVLALSGTPVTNSGLDLFPFLNKAIPKLDYISSESRSVCTFFDLFSDTFTNKYVTTYGIQYKGIKNDEQLNSLLKEEGKFFIRRAKEKVLKDLPEKSYLRYDLDLRVSSNIPESVIVQFEKDLEGSSDKEAYLARQKKAFGTLRRELGEAKAKSVDVYNYIDDIMLANKCALVFFYHKTVRDALKEKLKKKYALAVHDGDTSAFAKQQAIENFQSGKIDILLAQSESAVGYTATRTQDAIFIEYPWLSTQFNQACDRIYRIGQKNAVSIHMVICTNSLDRTLVQYLIQKQKGIDKLFKEGKYEVD